jgi:hypothetical protein
VQSSLCKAACAKQFVQSGMSLTIEEPAAVDDDVVVEYPRHHDDRSNDYFHTFPGQAIKPDQQQKKGDNELRRNTNQACDDSDAESKFWFGQNNCSVMGGRCNAALPPYPVSKPLHLPLPSHPSATNHVDQHVLRRVQRAPAVFVPKYHAAF